MWVLPSQHAVVLEQDSGSLYQAWHYFKYWCECVCERYCNTFNSSSVHWGCGLIATPDPCLHQHFLLPGSVQRATFTSFLAVFQINDFRLFSTVHPLFTAFILLFSVPSLPFYTVVLSFPGSSESGDTTIV